MTTKIKEKRCRVCGVGFYPKRSTLEVVCGVNCAIELGKKKVKIELTKNWNKEKVELKDKLSTLGDWNKKLQTEINTLVREIDKGHICISNRKPLNFKFDAGHFYSRGSNPSLSFNLMNIYGQSVNSNQHLSGDQINFLEGLELDFGKEHKEFVLSLKRLYPVLKLTKEEVKEKIPLVRSLIKWVKLQDKKFTLEERVSLRVKFNAEIGIYK